MRKIRTFPHTIADAGAFMMEKHSSPLFFRPTTYFGSYQNIEEEIVGEELDFADPWRIALEKDLVFPLRQNIGIFIRWHDPADFFTETLNEEDASHS